MVALTFVASSKQKNQNNIIKMNNKILKSQKDAKSLKVNSYEGTVATQDDENDYLSE